MKPRPPASYNVVPAIATNFEDPSMSFRAESLSVRILISCFTVLLVIQLAAALAGSPNMIVIMADDLGYGDLSCFGNQRIKTPHLDQLAEEGIRLTDFHSSGAVCSPTRAGLLTGRYQQRAGIPSVIFADAKQNTHPHGVQDIENTFAEQLKKAGYATAIFGKWHLGYYRHYNPTRHGFDLFRGYVSGNVDFVSHVDQAGRLDWWHNDSVEDEPGYTTHLITKHALSFIESHRTKQFLLYLAFEPPHYPYQGPHDPPVRTVGKARGKAETRQSQPDIQRAYKEMVEEMDTGIGQIVSALRQGQLDTNTLVMFCSDNGATGQGSNGKLRGHKGQLWEGGHRVPFIAWWPHKIKRGRVSHETAITLDIMPTMLDLANTNAPLDRPLDGVSLLPLLLDDRSLGPRQLFWQHGKSLAMRDGPWKLVQNGRGKQFLGLFNLAVDLAEEHNLAKQEPARLGKMLTAIETWKADVTETATPQPDTPPK